MRRRDFLLGAAASAFSALPAAAESQRAFRPDLWPPMTRGADFVAWNESNRIVRFKVMARPLKGIDMLRERMAAQLEKSR